MAETQKKSEGAVRARPFWKFWEKEGPLGPGSVVRAAGSYHILRQLGEGGMGRVFLADKRGEHGFSKLMAIKVLPSEKLGDERAATMFLDEARLAANLIHPNIVQVYQLAKTKHGYIIVMEHVFGVTLLEFIERHAELEKPVPLDFGVYILSRILSGLHYAHHKHSRDGVHLGIVHRDICPSNIMISFRGIAKLTDFGVAKAKTSKIESEKKVAVGKYPYMAPEQVRREGTDTRSDIYSLGLVMYELFTGRLVHKVTNTQMLLDDLKEPPPPPHIENPNIPEDLSKLIMQACALDKNDRFQSAKAMRAALDTFLLRNFMFPDSDALADYLTTIFPRAAKHRWW